MDRNQERGEKVEISSVVRVLKRQFNEAKARHPRVSLRGFAARANISHSALSEIFSGKRRLSKAKAEAIADTLKMTPEVRAEFLEDFGGDEIFSRGTKSIARHQLEADQFEMISRWHFFAILSLAETRGFVYDPDWISSRLGIPVMLAQEALAMLDRLDLLCLDENGQPRLTHKRISTADGIPSSAIRQSHVETLTQARAALETQPVENRYLTSMTFAMSPENASKVKAIIREALDQIDQTVERANEKTEVFKVSVQFFGVSLPA